jgi:hypothetical protein
MNDARLDDQIDLLCATHVTFPHNGDSALRSLGYWNSASARAAAA